MASTGTLHAAERDIPMIEIVPPRGVASDSLRVQTLVTSERIDRVDFVLDGRLHSSDHSFPFGTRIDARTLFGSEQLEAIAFDELGAEVTRDRLPLGDLPSSLRISISDVRELRGSGWWEVSAEVAHPSSSTIDRVDFYRDEHFAASTRREPFRARIPRGGDSTYLRAVAHLRDGGFAEGVRILEGGAIEDVLAVNLVELYAMVSDRRGRPVTRLAASDFSLHDGTRFRTPDRFAIGDDVPLSVALVLDSSGSMFSSMGRTKQAARLFLEQALDEHDEALLVDFATRPRLLQRRTNDVETLVERFDAISSRGGSAVYDAILFGLLQLEVAPGRKAMIVLTDGLDSGSRTTIDDCVAVARSSGVPVFVVSIGERLEHRPSHRTFALQRLAERSGGKVYEIAAEDQVPAAYREIDQQLRGQYLLTFSTATALSAAELDSLRLTISDDKLRVRAILGGQIQIMD